MTTMTRASSVTKTESKSRIVSVPTTPSRVRSCSSKANDLSSPKSKTVDGVSPSTRGRPKSAPRVIVNTSVDTQKARKSLALNKPKSGDDFAIPVLRLDKGKEFEEMKSKRRHGIQPQCTTPSDLRRKTEGDADAKKRELELRDKLDERESLIRNLEARLSELKVELEKAQSLNVELQTQNSKLSDELAAAEAKINALSIRDQMKRDTVVKDQTLAFKDIQKLIARKLEKSKAKEAVTETSAVLRPSALEVKYSLPTTTHAERKVSDAHSTLPTPPPPPPPPLPRLPVRAAAPAKASSVVQLYQSLIKPDSTRLPSGGSNGNKYIVSTAHNSIVGEIQNRSAHLLAIKSDIETKGEFINGLIKKVLDAAYPDIEDVLKFVDWLDDELSTLADERAVLKHFKWPEKKADAMREAAMEYYGLKRLDSEISTFKDDANIPCEVALKKMASLLDKSEKSLQRLINLRNSAMLSYQDHKIPTGWMLDSGIVSKIKKNFMMLANLYVKRITTELESIRYPERESSHEGLLLQGVQFAYRAHQLAGGLDSETLCAFEEIRRRVPEHLRESREILVGIQSS